MLNVSGPPMVHVTRSKRPEVVLFGSEQRFTRPVALRAGKIMVTTPAAQRGGTGDTIAVAKYEAGKPDQRLIVPGRIESVIRAVVQLGGTYPDIVQMLGEASAAGALPGRLEVDALPEAGRVYTPGQQLAEVPQELDLSEIESTEAERTGSAGDTSEDQEVASPRGELFSASGPRRGQSAVDYGPNFAPLPPKEDKKKTWLSGMIGR